MLKLLLAASVLVPLTLYAFYCFKSYGLAIDVATDDARRRATVLAEYTARTFEVHALLIPLIEQHLLHFGPGSLSSGQLDAILARHQPVRDLTVGIVLMDPAGVVLANTLSPKLQGRNFGDRDYFVRAQPSDGVVVGEQVTGRVTGQSFFSLSRRLPGGGVIVVAIYTQAFETVVGSLAGPDEKVGTMSLFREDGKQLARYPSLPKPLILTRDDPGLMQHIPEQVSGTYRLVPKTGPDERLFAFQQISGYPVWATYGVKMAAIHAGWLRDIAAGGALAVVLSCLLALLTLRALRNERLASIQQEHLQLQVAERTAEADRRAAEAERAHHAKSIFLASASHDLRQPIQGLRLTLTILDQQLENARDRQVLGLATKALEGAEDLLSALLDVSVLDSGMVPVNRGSVAIAPILSGLANEFSTQADGNGIRLRTPPCSAWVETDPVLLARVLRNLVANALRYTERGGILMGCRRVGGDKIRIEVWDSGPGIPEEKFDHVFEDFVQLGNPERDRARGLGLGLSVVRRMAALLEHPIGVRSRMGRGSVFWIIVPRAAEESPERRLDGRPETVYKALTLA